MAWTPPHRAFAVETFLRTGESIIATQRAFRTHFMLRRNDGVPDRKSIHLWVENFRATGSLTRSPGRPRRDQTPENAQTVRHSAMQSPTCSTPRKRPSDLGLSDRTKMVGQVLKDRKKRGQIEYLIRWKNFGAEEDSWEPETNLKNAGSILQDYIKNKATRKSRRSSSRSRSRSRSRTRLTRKKTEKEVASRESTPLKKSSRESTPVKKREPTPIKSLEISTPIEEDLEKAPPPVKEATPPPSPPSPPTTEEPVPPEPEEVTPEPPLKVVMELTNEGVEETPLTTFTSQITTETTEIFTPVSESVSTVLTRRMEMRAAAKATELEEEQKLFEEEVKEPELIELTKEVEEAKVDEAEVEEVIKDAVEDEEEEAALDAPASVPAAEDATSSPRKRLVNISGRKWPIILFILCLLVVGISIWVEKYFN